MSAAGGPTAEPHAVLRCANCGADVPITSPATVTATCGHCSALLLRRDVDVELLGEVALPAPLRSRFQIGTEGRIGPRAFVVRGQVQLDHGAGLWNEWAAETDEGWIWIAEAQGEVHLYEEVEGVETPSRKKLPPIDKTTGAMRPAPDGDRDVWRPGDHVTIAGDRWRVRELGRGLVVTFKGEFPIRMKVQDRTTYVDLVRGAGEVATLDYTRPGKAEFLRGRLVSPSELVLDPSTIPDEAANEVKSARVSCPHCGGTIEVQDEESALTLGCSHCGSTLQRANQLDAYRAVEEADRIRREPDIPIGSVGTLGGEELQILGMLQKGVFADGQTWRWREYLARTSEGAYRWLVESDGHWTLARPIPMTQVKQMSGRLKLGDDTARIFSSGVATVDAVLGEFYWQVRVGDRATTSDYVHPKSGRMVSTEDTAFEASMSLAHHIEPSEVEAAFPAAELPKRRGIGPAQPNPHSAAAAWKVFALLVLALTGSCVAIRTTKANTIVHEATYGPTEGVAQKEKVEFSEQTFHVPDEGDNLRIRFRAKDLSNGYIGINGALVNEVTGEVITFATSLQFYSGRSGGENWSEGSRSRSVLLGSVPRGPYRLRLAHAGWDRGIMTPFEVQVRTDVPRVLWFVLALVALLVLPIITSIRAGAFETRRWQNSDFS